jgi:hypothetical protein
MTEYEKFAQALALTESQDKQFSWGDDGLACGRWQMHPAWVDRYWPDDVGVDWSWDHLFRAALIRFWGGKHKIGRPTELAMEFHVGHWIEPTDHAWDKPYAARFEHHYAALEVPLAA